MNLPIESLKNIPLSVRSVSKNYGENQAVKDVSFQLRKGEIFGLLGPNGAGKSSLINIIVGLVKKSHGEISIFGADVERDYRRARSLVGVMHQELVVEKFFKIGKALALHSGFYGVKDDPKWRARLVKNLDLEPHLHKHYMQLSGGMKRRFMVAKAMIHKPRLLILDEPTAGVDVELRSGLWDFVREVNEEEDITVLLTTHYLEEAEQMCERIAILNHGEMIALENTDTLLKASGTRIATFKLEQVLTEVPSALSQFSPSLSGEGRMLELSLDAASSLEAIFQTLRDDGLTFTDIETKRSDLEDVFLTLTNDKGEN